jgi:hypothetical protein
MTNVLLFRSLRSDGSNAMWRCLQDNPKGEEGFHADETRNTRTGELSKAVSVGLMATLTVMYLNLQFHPFAHLIHILYLLRTHACCTLSFLHAGIASISTRLSIVVMPMRPWWNASTRTNAGLSSALNCKQFLRSAMFARSCSDRKLRKESKALK